MYNESGEAASNAPPSQGGRSPTAMTKRKETDDLLQPDEDVSEHEEYFDAADSVKAVFDRLEAARE